MQGICLGDGKVLVRPVYGGKLVVSADDLTITADIIISGGIEMGLTKYLTMFCLREQPRLMWVPMLAILAS